MAVNILESNMGKGDSQWFETASIDRYNILKEYAKENRRHMTDAEKALWNIIRQPICSYKFRRQHPIYDYIVDFICIEKKLIIEVDGAYHSEPQQQEAAKSFDSRYYNILFHISNIISCYICPKLDSDSVYHLQELH